MNAHRCAALMAVCLVCLARAEEPSIEQTILSTPEYQAARPYAIVLATVQTIRDGPKESFITARVTRVVKGPAQLNDSTIPISVAQDEGGNEPSQKPAVGKSAFFLLRRPATNGSWRTVEGVGIEDIYGHPVADAAIALQKWQERFLEAIDAAEPGTSKWAADYAGDPRHILDGAIAIDLSNLTPARLLALGSFAWLQSEGRVSTNGAVRDFNAVAGQYQAQHADSCDQLCVAVLERLFKPYAAIPRPALERYQASTRACWFRCPPHPDLRRTAAAGTTPADRSLDLLALATSPVPSQVLYLREKNLDFYRTTDRTLLGTMPTSMLTESADSHRRLLGLFLMIVHSPDQLSPILRRKLRSEGHYFIPRMDFFYSFLQIHDSVGVTMVMEEASERQLVQMIKVLTQIEAAVPEIAAAVGKQHWKALRETEMEGREGIIAAAREYERILPEAMRASVVPPPDDSAENALAAALEAQARAALGPAREGDPAERTDARNREAMGKLWDALWLTRTRTRPEIHALIAQARAHLSPPLIPQAPFRTTAPITAAATCTIDGKPRILLADNQGRLEVVDPATGSIVGYGPRIEKLRALHVLDQMVVADLGDGAAAFRLGEEKVLWQKKIEKPTRNRFDPPYLLTAQVHLFKRNDRLLVHLLFTDSLLTVDAADGSAVSRATVEKETRFFSERVNFCANGERLVAVGRDDTRVYTVASPELRRLRAFGQIPKDEDSFKSFDRPGPDISPSGKLAAYATAASVVVIDVDQGTTLATLPCKLGSSSALAFLGENLLGTSTAGSFQLWSLPDGKPLSEVKMQERSQWFSIGDGRLLVSNMVEFSLVDARTGKVVAGSKSPVPAPIVQMELRGERLLVSGGQCGLGRYHADFGEGVASIDLRRNQAAALLPGRMLGLSRDGSRILTRDGDELRVTNLADGAVVYRREVARAEKTEENWHYKLDAVLSDDGRYVWFTEPTGGATRVDIEAKRDVGRWTLGESPCALDLLSSSPGGKVVGSTVIQHMGQGVLFGEGVASGLLGPRGTMRGKNEVAFSPDEKLLVMRGRYVCQADGTPLAGIGRGLGPRIYEERGSEEIASVKFSPDGRWLATLDQASRGPWDIDTRDTLVRIWDTRSWELVARYAADGVGTGMVWADDSKSVYVGYAGGAVARMRVIKEQ